MFDDNKNNVDQAIALYFDGREAPEIVAKGDELIAQQIIDIAKAHDVPVYHDVGLANLFSQMDIGDRVPEPLYIVIAEIIAFAYMMVGKTPDGFNQ